MHGDERKEIESKRPNACHTAAGRVYLEPVNVNESTSRIGRQAAFARVVRSSLCIGLAAVVCLFGAARMRAVTLQEMSMTQLAQMSTSIVRGQVTAASTAVSGGTIFTHYTVKVQEQWKGANSSTVDVALPGGVSGGRRQAFPGVPVLVPGQEYVLYLWAGSSGQAQPVGMTQGIFTVSTDATGNTAASRKASGELMVNANGRAVSDHPVNLQLSAMRAQVQAAVREHGSK